jgi:glycosyltransferase involved in cell wall biosynthesis
VAALGQPTVPRRARVLVLITLAERGGAQAYVASLLPALAEEFELAVAAHGDGFLRDAAAEAGVRFIPLTHLGRAIDLRGDARALGELRALMRREKPQILHANSSKAGVIGRLAAVATGVPVRIFTVHGWAFKAYQGAAATIYLWADRLMRPLTTWTVCVAESERAAGLRARTCGPGNTVVIRNGVDLNGPRRRHELASATPTVLAVGRFRYPKDFPTLVRAVAQLAPGTLRVLIAGDGPERPALEAEIASLGVADAVELLGERDDVPDLLAGADVLALPSLSEGMPMSVLEAMAAGLPVVASHVGGVGELVVDGATGMLVPPADPAALAGALNELAADPGLRARMGEAGRRRAEAEFSLERFRRAHVDLYRESLRQAARPRARR